MRERACGRGFRSRRQTAGDLTTWKRRIGRRGTAPWCSSCKTRTSRAARSEAAAQRGWFTRARSSTSNSPPRWTTSSTNAPASGWARAAGSPSTLIASKRSSSASAVRGTPGEAIRQHRRRRPQRGQNPQPTGAALGMRTARIRTPQPSVGGFRFALNGVTPAAPRDIFDATVNIGQGEHLEV